MNTNRAELPRLLYRAEQVRELDRVAIEEHKLPGIELMEAAGKAVFEVLRSYWPQAGHIVIVCGAGNNAGDGYILARLAKEAGMLCDVIAMQVPEKLSGDAKTAAEKYLALAEKTRAFSPASLDTADVIVDAILGTGLDREVQGEYRQCITGINAAGKPVLSIDIPSGLNADNGQVMGEAIRAEATVTFIGLKQGLFTGEGLQHSGSILFSDLGVPQEIYTSQVAAAERLDNQNRKHLLRRRPRSSHKGNFGHVLVIGGDYGKAGAARMAAEAAARVGAGLVTVATRPEHAMSIPSLRPELMTCAVERPTDLNSALENASVIVIGPGLGQSEWAQALLAHVLEAKLPLLLDADALNLLAQEPCRCDRWVMTPHPGEAARLLDTSSAAIQSDRYASAKALQQKYDGVMVLKGSGTVIADEQGLSVCTAGNPGMASGGMGDVLSGVIAALMAQGLGLSEAAKLGVCLHADAADAAAEDGERGMLATDLMPFLRELANPDG